MAYAKTKTQISCAVIVCFDVVLFVSFLPLIHKIKPFSPTNETQPVLLSLKQEDSIKCTIYITAKSKWAMSRYSPRGDDNFYSLIFILEIVILCGTVLIRVTRRLILNITQRVPRRWTKNQHQLHSV